jgi:o-succinylbenzoate---CoA ligase
MVAALHPEDFLAGVRSSGRVMPHAQITTEGDEGRIRIRGESIFRGYWPDSNDAREFVTEDVGTIDPRGYVRVTGRRDAVIITGGKKVHPADVEAVLRASGEFSDVAVIGVPDAEWGEIVVACHPRQPDRAPAYARAVEALPGHQRPKRFVAIDEWPRNAQGKVNRALLRAAAERSG